MNCQQLLTLIRLQRTSDHLAYPAASWQNCALMILDGGVTHISSDFRMKAQPELKTTFLWAWYALYYFVNSVLVILQENGRNISTIGYLNDGKDVPL